MLPLCEQISVINLEQHAGEEGKFITGNDAGRGRIDLQPQPRALQYRVLDTAHDAYGLPAVVQVPTEARNAPARPGVLTSYAISHRILRETDHDADF